MRPPGLLSNGPRTVKKALNVVAVVASVASIIPGPIGTACALVSAGAYAASGNWKQAAIMAAGAALAFVGAGAVAVAAVGVVRVASKVASATRVAKVMATAARARWVGKVVDDGEALFSKIKNGNQLLRIGRPKPGLPRRISIGPAYNHYKRMGPLGRFFNPIHVHMERKYGGIDFNWFTKHVGNKFQPRNWTWWD